MKNEDFKNVHVKGVYGEFITIIEINDTVAKTEVMGTSVNYHTSKIFHKGKSVQGWLNEENN
jgi:hypothetical protein